MEQTIAIVGTAGRKDDAQKLYPEMFTAMVERTREAITLLENDPLAPPGAKLSHAVSGGAAWADHIAVRLFNNCLLYTSPSPRDGLLSRMPSSA